MLTQKLLKEFLHYNKETGDFTWKESRGKAKKGFIAGYYKTPGYIVIGLLGRVYYAHRLAWLFVYGYIPENQLDHINRVMSDNKIANLREVSQTCNNRNRSPGHSNKTGVSGVQWNKKERKWRAFIPVNGKQIYVAYTDIKIDAVKARWEAEVNNDWPNCNTTSSAFVYLKKHGAI